MSPFGALGGLIMFPSLKGDSDRILYDLLNYQ